MGRIRPRNEGRVQPPGREFRRDDRVGLLGTRHTGPGAGTSLRQTITTRSTAVDEPQSLYASDNPAKTSRLERGQDPVSAIGYGDVDQQESVRASRDWWDAEADDYQAEHGDFLGSWSPAGDFVWCPEGLREVDAHLLGPVEDLAGRRILEVGAGAAQCSRWLAGIGAEPVALDLSAGQLRPPRDQAAAAGQKIPLVQADATVLPFADASIDVACSAFG